MIKKNGCLTMGLAGVKRILHQHKDVYITWLRFGRDERSKHDKSCQPPSTFNQFVDMFQSTRHKTSLDVPCSKILECFIERCLINPYG